MEEALNLLSPLEREAYLMSRGKGISFSEIGLMLGIEETTIANKIERPERKLLGFKRDNLVG
nr:sigma factor-like helix-turn-helix DNA-binding protein [Seinonella peptonophila]